MFIKIDDSDLQAHIPLLFEGVMLCYQEQTKQNVSLALSLNSASHPTGHCLARPLEHA